MQQHQHITPVTTIVPMVAAESVSGHVCKSPSLRLALPCRAERGRKEIQRGDHNHNSPMARPRRTARSRGVCGLAFEIFDLEDRSELYCTERPRKMICGFLSGFLYNR